MSELRLHDHSKPCKHGFQHPHGWVTPILRGTDSGWEFCYGGKEIVLQREECFRPEAHPGGHDCDGHVWVEVVEE